MRAHLELRTQANIGAGMSPEEARFAALRQFGWTESIKEECRDQRGIRWLENLVQDIRYGGRQLRKNPGFTVVAVLTLALGVCAVTTQFSLFNGLLLRGLPFPEPDRLISVGVHDSSQQPTELSLSDFLEWQRQQQSCEGLAASDSYRWLNVVIEGASKPVGGLFVTHNFFSLLGIRPLLGRDFVAGDEQPGAEPVALISHGLWEREFGGVPDVVGRTLRLEGRVTTVIGVMPPRFNFPGHQEIWAPFLLSPEKSPRSVGVLARLKPGVREDQAQAEFTTITERLARNRPAADHPPASARVEALHQNLVGGMRNILSALLAAASAVLVIACVNVMNLQFARVSSRMRELALRGALGASRGRLLRQTLTEGALVVALGGVVGVALTRGATRFFQTALGQIRFDAFPAWAITDINSTVLLFTLAIIAAAILASSLLPALLASRADAISVLKEGAHGQTNRLVSRIGGGLVIAQISLTCALLIVSLLQLKSITRHANVDVGFKSDGVLAGRLSLAARYRTPEARTQIYERLLRALRADPAFTQVALTSRALAVGGGFSERFQVDDRRPSAPADGHLSSVEYVSDGYFAALELRPRQGREFQAGERRRGEPPALVNESFERTHFGGVSALGRRIRLWRADNSPSEWRTIVGVVPDTHLENFDPHRDGSGVFLPMEESVPNFPTVVVRGRARADTLTEPLRRAVAQVDPDLTLYGVGTPRANLRAFNGQARVVAGLSSLFAFIACALATVGLYGVASYAVSQRTRDLGIRMALGADRARIMGLVLGRGGLQFVVGAAVGVAVALAFVQVGGARFEAFLYQVNPRDPVIYGTVVLLLAAATLLACLIPARRAGRVDPMVVLRAE